MTEHTVLFVDDEEKILKSLTRLFEEEEGLRLRTALGGEEALAVLRKEQVSLVLSDHRMPGMNGIEFFQKAIH